MGIPTPPEVTRPFCHGLSTGQPDKGPGVRTPHYRCPEEGGQRQGRPRPPARPHPRGQAACLPPAGFFHIYSQELLQTMLRKHSSPSWQDTRVCAFPGRGHAGCHGKEARPARSRSSNAARWLHTASRPALTLRAAHQSAARALPRHQDAAVRGLRPPTPQQTSPERAARRPCEAPALTPRTRTALLRPLARGLFSSPIAKQAWISLDLSLHCPRASRKFTNCPGARGVPVKPWSLCPFARAAQQSTPDWAGLGWPVGILSSLLY